MSTDTKCIEFAKQIKDLREYGPFAKDLARDEVANAFEALLEIVAEWPVRPKSVEDLQAEVTDLRRQKADLVTSLDATMTAWHKDKAGLESQLDATTKRAELAEATLERVRAAVAKPVEVKQDGPPKPVEVKQDGPPKAGDVVFWSEVEAGCLYAGDAYYPFRMVVTEGSMLQSGPEDPEIEECLNGDIGKDMSDTREIGGETTLIARDLGSDPEAWRAAMREHLAKVGA